MSYYFNTNFLTRLQAGAAFSTSIVVYLFEQAPSFDVSEPVGEGMASPSYAGIDTPSALATQLGWGPYIKGPAVTTTQSLLGTNFRYVHLAAPNQLFNLASDFPTKRIRALVFCENLGTPATDKILFATNTALGGGTVLNHYDSLMPQHDTGTNANVLFSWVRQTAPTPQTAKEGSILILRGAPPFESARTQHVWIYPQRVNLVCNPSFEGAPLTTYWRSNGTLAQVTPAPPGSGVNAGRVSGTDVPLVLESNFFPLSYGRRRESGWTIQLQARCHGDYAGQLKVALLTWEDDFTQTYADWGTEQWAISGGFTQIRTMRGAGESYMGQLRIEVQGCPYFDIDQVCVEPGLLPTNAHDWPYFDGASLYDNEGDYAWYGGEARANATYSCWYNFRYPTFGRLFARLVDPVPPGGVFTELDEAEQGAVYQWVPAGTQVESHLDVLYPHDPRSQPAPLTGDPHEYKDEGDPDTTPLGVERPVWR